MENIVIYEGLVGRDIEVQFTPNGKQYGKWSLAQSYKNKKEEKITIWINCISYSSNIIEYLKKIIKKGNRVMINGELNVRTYEKDGKKNTVYEVIVKKSWLIESVFEDSNKAQQDKEIQEVLSKD
jgi:single-strand DNA-binding protein